jgi:hypothetical protein
MQFLSIKTHSKTHNMFFFIILSYVLLTNIILSEVITLIENKNITCVSSQDSVVYITPLMNTGLPLIEISENINDWIKTDSTNASFGPVTDQRWEGNCFDFLNNYISQINSKVFQRQNSKD